MSTLFVYLSDKGKTSLDRRVLLFLAFLLVTIPSAIRYDVGTDYLNYVEIYNSINYGREYLEPAYYLLNISLNSIGAHFQWVFAISAFLFSLLVFKSYPIRKAWIVHLLFFGIFLFYSFNILRQTIAIAFCLLAISKFINKEYLLYFALCFMGFLFHSSALIMVFLGLLALIPVSNNFKSSVAPLLFSFALVLTFLLVNSVTQYIGLVLPYIGLADYQSYFSGKYFVGRENATGLTVIFWMIFAIYTFFNIKLILNVNREYWIIILMMFLYSFTFILSFNIVIFGRLTLYFSLAPILLAHILWQLPVNKSLNRLVVFLVISFVVIMFSKVALSSEESNKVLKIVPYKTIFSLE